MRNGKDKVRGDWGKSIRLFDRLIWAVIGDGTEVWG